MARSCAGPVPPPSTRVLSLRVQGVEFKDYSYSVAYIFMIEGSLIPRLIWLELSKQPIGCALRRHFSAAEGTNVPMY